MWQTTVRGSHLHYDIEVIPLSLNISHTYHIQQTTDAKKKQAGGILQCHQNHSVLIYMYIVCVMFVIMLTPESLSVYTIKGVVTRITCECLLTCIQFQVLF